MAFPFFAFLSGERIEAMKGKQVDKLIDYRPCHVLLIDDDEDDYILALALLSDCKGMRFTLKWAETYDAGLEMACSGAFDIVLVDFDLGERNGIQLITTALERGIKIPFIMVTGRGSYELDLEAMRAGAVDYLSKDDLVAPLLERAIRYAIERKHTENELRQARQDLELRVQERTLALTQSNEELRTALEELATLEEELRHQNDELLEAGQVLELERQHFQTLFEFAPVGYLVTDPAGIITEVNQTFVELINTQKKPLISKPLVTLIAGDKRQDFRNNLNILTASRQQHNWETRVLPRRQEPFLVSITAAPVVDLEGNLAEVHWIVSAFHRQEKAKVSEPASPPHN